MKLFKKSNGVYFVSFKDQKGKPHTKSLGTKNKLEAQRLVKESNIENLERAAVANSLATSVAQVMVSGKRVTPGDALEEFKESLSRRGRSNNTIHIYGVMIGLFIRQYPQPTVLSYSVEQVDKFVNDTDISVGLKARKERLSNLRNFFDFIVTKGYRADNPAKDCGVRMRLLSHTQKEGRPVRAFKKSEYNALRHYFEKLIIDPPPRRCKEADKAVDFLPMTAIAYWTGLRFGDVCQLEWDCINDEGIIVWTDKRDKRVRLPFNDPLIGDGELFEAFEQMPQDDKQYCFPRQRYIMDEPSYRSRLSTDFRRSVERAGLSTCLTFHSLRRSFVTRLARAGRTLEEIGVFVAHADERMTEHYKDK